MKLTKGEMTYESALRISHNLCLVIHFTVPVIQENARAFHSKPLVDVDPKCLLYVQQREFAATTPADSK